MKMNKIGLVCPSARKIELEGALSLSSPLSRVDAEKYSP